MKLILGLVALIAVGTALPLLFKDEKKSDPSFDELMEELNNEDNKLIEKSETSKTQIVDGKVEKTAEIKEEIKNAKTGETVAAISKTESQTDGEKPKSETKVDIPSADIHKTEQSEDSELLISPEDVAGYIVRTGDVDGVQQTFDSMNNDQNTDKDHLEKFAAQVQEQLKRFVPSDTPEPEEPSKEGIEKQEFNEMLDLADLVESGEEEAKQKIYNLAIDLYTRSVEGDELAGELLLNYIDAIRDGPSLRIISMKTKEDILDLVEMALIDVNAYLKEDDQLQTEDNSVSSQKTESKPKTDGSKTQPKKPEAPKKAN